MTPRRGILATAIMVAAAVTALPSTSKAQDDEPLTWYAIEIIVFERTSEVGRSAEAWPADPGLPQLADALELSVEGMAPEDLASRPAGETENQVSDAPGTDAAPEADTPPEPAGLLPRAFQLVPPEEYRLTDAWKSLEKSSAYRPLLHLGWIQPGFPAEEARLVHVRNDNAGLGAVTIDAEPVDEGAVAGTSPDDYRAGDAPTLSPRIDMARDPSRVALDGTVRVHRARYLHVQADLLYYRPGDDGTSTRLPAGDDPTGLPPPDSPDTAYIEQLLAEEDAVPRLFRLTESRRMRSRELHYLDHPLFGVLVEAWPVELPELPPEPELTPLEGDTAEPTPAGTSG